MPYLSCPRHRGSHAGRPFVLGSFRSIPGVLLITTPGWLTHLTCGQTSVGIMEVQTARSWRMRQHPSFRAKKIAPATGHRRFLCPAAILALFPLSLTCVSSIHPHGWICSFQVAPNNVCRSPYSPRAQAKSIALTKTFSIFSGSAKSGCSRHLLKRRSCVRSP